MSDAVIIAIVGSITSTMALVLTLLINRKATAIAKKAAVIEEKTVAIESKTVAIEEKTFAIEQKTVAIEEKQGEMHKDINGRITQLLAAKDEVIAGKQEISKAEGKAEEKKEEQERKDSKS